MPIDSLNVNNKSKSQNTYDAIVIGSGISGGWAAKELCEAGLTTLVLERGRNVEHNKDYQQLREKQKNFYSSSILPSIQEPSNSFST